MSRDKRPPSPGPWKRVALFVNDANNEGVCKVHLREDDSQFANANLIAAAPDLYEAAQKALEDLETWHDESGAYQGNDGGIRSKDCGGCVTCDETIPALQAALAKARGEA